MSEVQNGGPRIINRKNNFYWSVCQLTERTQEHRKESVQLGLKPSIFLMKNYMKEEMTLGAAEPTHILGREARCPDHLLSPALTQSPEHTQRPRASERNSPPPSPHPRQLFQPLVPQSEGRVIQGQDHHEIYH